MTNHLKRTYVSLMLSPFFSQIGSAIYVLGLNWLIVKSTGTTQLLGIIEGIGGFAFLIGDLLVGLLVDQHNRKYVLIWTDIIATLVCVVSSFLINNNTPQIWLLILITFILNLMLALNYPAAKSIVPEVINGNYLQKFNALSNTFFGLANIIAPVIGGVLLAINGIDFSEFILINAASYFIALFFNLLITYQPTPSVKNHQSESFLISTISGFKYVLEHKKLLLYMTSMGIFNFVCAGFLLTTPYISSHYFSKITSSYSLFLICAAVGGLVGGLWLTVQKQKISSNRIFAEQICYGIILILGSLKFSIYSWIIIALVYGLIQSRFFGSMITFIQEETDISFLGRIFGLTFLFFDGIQPVGSFIFGFFVSTWGSWTYSVLGSLTVSLFGLIYFFNRKTFE